MRHSKLQITLSALGGILSLLLLIYWALPANRNGLGIQDGALIWMLGAFAFAPWIRWRFSLHTLCAATMLGAAGFGLAMWAVR